MQCSEAHTAEHTHSSKLASGFFINLYIKHLVSSSLILYPFINYN